MRVREITPSVFVLDVGPILTVLEVAILQAAADGETCEQTAERMHYSLYWIKQVCKKINVKLNAKNKTHAMAIAWRAGVIK